MPWVLLVVVIVVGWLLTEGTIHQRGQASKESTARNIRSERWWGVKFGLFLAVVIAFIAAASH